MSDLTIKKGSLNIVYEGVSNMEELKIAVLEKAEKYKNFVVSDNNIKEAENIISEIIPLRKPIKDFRASVNKQLTAKVKEKLYEIDEITNIFNNIVEPLKEKIDSFKEEKRIKRLEEKKAEFKEIIDERNSELETINNKLFYKKIDLLEFKEEWANKKNDNIIDLINLNVTEKRKEINFCLERIENVKTKCELLKLSFDLAADINWEVLQDRIYNDNWKEQLEEIAIKQQEQELQVIEKQNEIQEFKKNKITHEDIVDLDNFFKEKDKECLIEIKIKIKEKYIDKLKEFLKKINAEMV